MYQDMVQDNTHRAKAMQIPNFRTPLRSGSKQSCETLLYALLVRDDREPPGSIQLGDSLGQGHLQVHGRVGVELKAHQVCDDLRVGLRPEKKKKMGNK